MFGRIKLRLTLGYVGVLAAILVVFGGALVLGFWHQTRERQDEMLLELARGGPQAISRLQSGDRSSLEGLFSGSSKTSDFEPEIAVIYASSGGISSSEVFSGAPLGLPNRSGARAALKLGGSHIATVAGPSGPVRVASVPVEEDGRVVAVAQAAQSARQVTVPVERLLFILIPIGAGALALAALGGLAVSRRAMRPAEDAFERQRDFVADASHELKTPLTLIRADAEVLARGSVSAEDRELVEDLLQETDRMSEVLSDLLLLARLDAGKLSVSRETFDLSGLLRRTSGRFEARARDEGVELLVEGEEVYATGDASRAGQIISAVLDNALRFTPTGGRVTLSAESSGSWSTVEISDTGPGIPEGDRARIFDRFYRAEEARTRRGGGSGLGLAIASDLARAQGGTLSAENRKEAGGAVFRLSLPAAKSAPEPAPEQTGTESKAL